MSTFSSETAWLCLAVTAALGGLVLCKLKSPGQVWGKGVCLAGLWGGACLLSLSLFWSLILFSLSCFLLYTYLSGQELLPVDQKAVLITGGDSGIGHALCKYLDQLGFTVFAGVLNENGSGAEELRRTCSTRFSVLQLDVTDSQQIKDAYSKVVQKVQNRGLWAVVNNAGILGLPADGELIPMIHYKRCMDVNFFGAVEVTKTFLPLLRKSKGRLVNISSMAGGVPLLKMAAYGSSKAALTMFSAVMRQELSKWEVKVSNIQPGGFKTNITGTSEMQDKLEKDILDHLTPDVQEEYGRDYILAQKNVFNAVSTYASSDVSPVLQDIQHAISAKSPFTFYTPGLRSNSGKANMALNLCSQDLQNTLTQMGTTTADCLMPLPPMRAQGVFHGQTIKYTSKHWKHPIPDLKIANCRSMGAGGCFETLSHHPAVSASTRAVSASLSFNQRDF